MYCIAVFEVTLHTGDTNEATKFVVSADLKVFLPLFSDKMVCITLTSIQVHRKKSLCAKFDVTFVSLVYAVNGQF